MAITRAQQAKQMLQDGGRIGLRFGSEGYQGGRTDQGGAGPGPSTSPEKAGGDNNYTDRIIDVAERIRRQDLRNLATKGAEEKIEEKLEPFRNLGSNTRKFQNFAKRYLPSATFLSKFGPLNLRDFYTEKFLNSKNAPFTKEEFAMLPEEEKEELFNKYEKARGLGEIDAYGNPIGDTGGDGLPILLPQMTAQAPSITEEKEEEPFTPNFRLLAGGGMADETVGGIMDLESARQMYGLGKLVKKVTRGIKKIAKSPIGKAAILGAGTYFGLGKFGATKDLGILAKLGIAGTVAGLPFLAQKEEEEKPLYAGADIDDPSYIMNNPQLFLNRRLSADGGLMRTGYQEGSKEPVAKKVMPLLDMDGKEKDYRETGGFVDMGRMEKADDVPARLSKNEFVFTADAVRNAGDGSVDKGAEVMYNMMKNLEAGGDVSEESQGLEGARKMFQTSQRLEEVL